MTFLIAALYKFVEIDAPAALRDDLARDAAASRLVGTLLIAAEGVNGTIAGAPERLRDFLERMRGDPRIGPFVAKESASPTQPFRRLKVRLKREIVSMGAPGVVSPETVGAYAPPREWDALLADPNVEVIDTRNDYEVALGRFARPDGAPPTIDPKTERFRDFPAWAEANLERLRAAKAVAMYCTGGIRCEKATALVRSLGVSDVRHLEGGVLRYIEETPVERSGWIGDCFVFDDRVSVDAGLNPGAYGLCRGCRRPISDADRADPRFVDGVACPACAEATTAEQARRRAERERQIALATARGETHLKRDPAA